MKIIILGLMLFLVVGCNGQHDKNINPVIEKKQDTISYYKTNEILKHIEMSAEPILSQDTINFYNSLDKNEYVKDSKIYKLRKDGYSYIKSCKLNIQNFTYYIIYDHHNLKIKRSGVSFIGMPIGVHTYYDENGKITKERDFDLGFKLTVDDFILIAKNDLDIDLNKDIEGIRIGRNTKDKDSYFITIPMGYTEIGYYRSREIVIDANNGKIIRDEIVTATES